jgi:hypothetical protein
MIVLNSIRDLHFLPSKLCIVQDGVPGALIQMWTFAALNVPEGEGQY